MTPATVRFPNAAMGVRASTNPNRSRRTNISRIILERARRVSAIDFWLRFHRIRPDFSGMSEGDIGIVVAEDHKLVRQGILLVLSRESRLRVLGEAGDGESAWRLTVALKPTVLILDLGLPGIDGLDLMQLLTAKEQGTRVLVVTARQDAASVRAALARGAQGYLLKTDDADALLKAIFTVAEGGYYVSPELANVVDEEAAEESALTPREHEIACAVARGLSSKVIGARAGHLGTHCPQASREHRAQARVTQRCRAGCLGHPPWFAG